MYVGAALAVGLFDRLAPSAVAVMRLIGAAAVLLAWRRPPAAAWRGRRFVRATAFGLATGLMNLAFYEAIARLPLGTAVADRVLRAGGGRRGRVAAAPRRRRGAPRCGRRAAHRRCPLVSGALGGRVGARGRRDVGGVHRARRARRHARQRRRRHGGGLRRRGRAALAGAAARQSRWRWRRSSTRPSWGSVSASACCPAWCPTCWTRSSCGAWVRPGSPCCSRCCRPRRRSSGWCARPAARAGRGGRHRGGRRGGRPSLPGR